MDNGQVNIGDTLTAERFVQKYNRLVIAAWMVPALFGLSFIAFIEVLTLDQLFGIMITPTEPAFIIMSLLFARWYLARHIQPVVNYLSHPEEPQNEAMALVAMKGFSFKFWVLFMAYLLAAPATVILSAQFFTDYVAQPVDWFRIHLVALIVSIIVGLPIFFMMLDLFGRVMAKVELQTAHVTVKTKVFLIGSLVPLLIDTMLVQYYWTRTGYFSFETFLVWLLLEMLAVAGSLIFTRSFGQSLAPLQDLSSKTIEFGGFSSISRMKLSPQSTDEIGVLTHNFKNVLEDLQVYSEVLELSNRLLRELGNVDGLEKVSQVIINNSIHSLGLEKAFIILHDQEKDRLACIASTEGEFNIKGQFSVALDDVSLASMVFHQNETVAIRDVQNDDRCSIELRRKFNTRSAIGTPITVEGKKIGVLMATTDTGIRNYTNRESLLIEGLSREAGIAIHTQQLRTEKMQAIEKGRERKELVSLLMESTEEGIYGVDTEGVCTFINKAALGMLGYENEGELLGEQMHALIHHTYPNGRPYPFEECLVRKATKNDQSGHADSEVHWRKDGSSFPVEYWSHPVKKEGIIVGSVVAFVDISKRLEDERKLRESQDRLNSVVSNVEVILFALDMDGIYTLSEGAGLQRLGRVSGDTVGISVREVHKGNQALLASIDRALSGEEFVIDLPVAGHIFETHYTPMHENGGQLVGTIGVAIDVTERLQAQELISQTKEQLELAIDAGNIGIWEWDIESGQVIWSGKTAKLFGLENGQFEGTLDAFIQFIHPDDTEKVNQAIQNALHDKVPYRVEHRIIRADGKTVWLYEQANVRYDVHGSPKGMIGIATDITPIKQAEEVLRQHKDELEETVKKRTSELEAANKELESFSYSVSHDLRAPLRGIDGFSLALLEDYESQLDETAKDYLHRVRKGTQKMSVLIDDMLNFSRMSRAEMKQEKVNLSAIARKLIEKLQQESPQRQVEISIEDDIVFIGDKRLMSIVMENLLSNAWKYTAKKEKAKISMGLQYQGDRNVVYVRDNGAGFDMKYAGKLFGVFQRLHSDNEFPGTGVGLATVKRILARHNAEVWAESEIDKQTTFYFSLPTNPRKS